MFCLHLCPSLDDSSFRKTLLENKSMRLPSKLHKTHLKYSSCYWFQPNRKYENHQNLLCVTAKVLDHHRHCLGDTIPPCVKNWENFSRVCGEAPHPEIFFHINREWHLTHKLPHFFLKNLMFKVPHLLLKGITAS